MVFSDISNRGCVSTLDRKGEGNYSYFPSDVSYGQSAGGLEYSGTNGIFREAAAE